MVLNRRTFVTSSAACGLATTAIAKAPLLGRSRPRFRRVSLGDFEVTVLDDGVATVGTPQSYFATDQTVETVDAFMTQNFLPKDEMEFTFFPVVVNTGEQLVLIDTGNGPTREGAETGLLIESLSAAGYTPDQVDVVVITHMHPDHIGGMMADGAPAFPKARYFAGAVDYDFWNSENLIGSPGEGLHHLTRKLVAPFADQTTFINPGDTIASGIEAMETYGHTPGHLAIHLESRGERLVFISDAATHFAISLQHPEWESRFDWDKEQSAKTRRKLFDMLATDRIPFTGYHMPFPALGYVERDGSAYRYIPSSYQFNI